MKNSTKPKELESTKTKSKTAVKPENKSLSAEEMKVLNLWQSEVQCLVGREYKNFDEALEAVIAGVISKVDKQAQSSPATREFLYEFMTSDPEIVREIKNIFNVR